MSINKKVALIIVDPQVDFGHPSGSLYVPEGEQIVAEVNALRAALTHQGVQDVFITQDWHPAEHVSFCVNNPGTKLFDTVTLADGVEQVMWPVHCVQGSDGAGWMSGLTVLDSDVIVQKGTNRAVDSYSGFASNDGVGEVTQLNIMLLDRGITHVVVCGLAFEYCVGFTALDAAKRGFQVCVVGAATRGISLENCGVMMDRMKSTGAVSVVMTVADAVAFASDAVAVASAS
jgi:nicotinamidase/pyrazinamidase